ncbi:MAG TPA: hypothetical protein ENF66_01250, partial [Firmicutes bacterium]|nr:hypothetical protein [Bacillota bacterium]
MKLKPDRKIDIREILKGLENYKPRRYGWTWREKIPEQKIGMHTYFETSKPLKKSIPLPASRQMDYI